MLVTHSLAGMMKLCSYTSTHCKQPLSEDELVLLLDTFTSSELDNLIFLTNVLSSFHVLLCLGESTQPDSWPKHSFHKIVLCHSVKLTPSSFSFMLPTHKADWFFESSMILIKS